MKSVMLSIQPRHCENICTVIGEENGKPVYKKTIEVRKKRPKLETPFKCYVYETNKKEPNHLVWIYGEWRIAYGKRGKGKVICEFVCDRIDEYNYDFDGVNIDEDTLLKTMLDREEINIYAKGKTLYGLHITDLKIYDKPKELREFRKPCPFPSEDCEELCKYAEVRIHTAGDEELIEIVDCHNRFTRPPQSWCYVEEL